MTTTEPAETTAVTGRDVVIGKLVARLRDEHFGTGPLAELRRMDPGTPSAAPPALHRTLGRHVPERWLHCDGFEKWALLLHLLALAAPSPPGNVPPLGEALFDAGYSEGRLTNLLQAEAGTFPVVLPRMVRFLVAKEKTPNPYELANLVLSRNKESVRLKIAHAFYRAESAKDKAET